MSHHDRLSVLIRTVMNVSCLIAILSFLAAVHFRVSLQNLLLKRTEVDRHILSTCSFTLLEVLLSLIVLSNDQVLPQSSAGTESRGSEKVAVYLVVVQQSVWLSRFPSGGLHCNFPPGGQEEFRVGSGMVSQDGHTVHHLPKLPVVPPLLPHCPTFLCNQRWKPSLHVRHQRWKPSIHV